MPTDNPTSTSHSESILDSTKAHREHKSHRLCSCDPNAARSLREAAGLSVEELAKLAGVSRVTVWRLEKPGNQFTLRVLRDVARAIDTAMASRTATLSTLLGRR